MLRFGPDRARHKGSGTDSQVFAWAAAAAAAGAPPTAARVALMSGLVSSIKNAGLWRFDRLWLANETQTEGNIDIVAQATWTPHGTTYTNDRGWVSSGSPNYIQSGFIASTMGVNYTLNSSSLHGYFNTNRAAADSTAAYGTDNGTGVQTAMSLRLAAGTQDAYLNNTFAAGHASGTIGDTLGLASVSRTAANLTTTLRRGVSLGTTAAAAAAVPTVDMAVLAFNNNGSVINFETARLALFAAGGGYSVAETLQLNGLFEANYLTSIGANA